MAQLCNFQWNYYAKQVTLSEGCVLLTFNSKCEFWTKLEILHFWFVDDTFICVNILTVQMDRLIDLDKGM